MKQGIDPTTHKPLTEEEMKEKNNLIDCSELKESLPMAEHQHGVSTMASPTVMPSQGPTFLVNDSSYFDGGVSSRAAFDSLSYFEFQAGLEPPSAGYNSDLVASQFQQTNIRPHFETASSFGFASMLSLANSDHRSMSGTYFSDNSASRLSSFFMNEVLQAAQYLMEFLCDFTSKDKASELGRGLCPNCGFGEVHAAKH